MFKIVQRKEKEGDRGEDDWKLHSPCPRIVPKQHQSNAEKSQTVKKTEQSAKAEKNTAFINKMPNYSLPRMEASIQLIDDGFELLDSLKEFIIDTNKKFTVIGAIGAQGTGKSTILSMLAGNDALDMYRQYIFRPCAREAVESSRYQTTKIFAYISRQTRIFFLDCQPLNCAPLLEDCSHSYRSKAGPLESLELESQQLLLLLANVCHTILLCIDWFIDLSIIRRLMRIELFPNFLQTHGVNIVVLHHRAKSQDFQSSLIEERMRLLGGIFSNTLFKVNTGLTMAKLGIPSYEHITTNVNYIVLSEMKPRTRIDIFPHDIYEMPYMDYGFLMTALRSKIFNLPKHSTGEMTEGKWYSRLAECWNKLKQELPLVTDDGYNIQRSFKLNVGKYGEPASQMCNSLEFESTTKNIGGSQAFRKELFGSRTMGRRIIREGQPKREWKNKRTVIRRKKNDPNKNEEI